MKFSEFVYIWLERGSQLSTATNNAETVGNGIGNDSDCLGMVKTHWEPAADD
jgi:hypothetical protein